MAHDETGIDTGRLAAWMDSHDLPGAGAPLTVDVISGGNQNIVARVGRGDVRMVLRRPPLVIPAGREAAMVREFRLLSALEGTDVPHASPVALCEDVSVLGTTFYLMSVVDGWSPASSYMWPEPFDRDVAVRTELVRELISSLVKLGQVDWRAQGLEGFGKPDNFHERQVDRWLHHWSAFKFRDIPGLDEAGDWLRVNIPQDWTPGIMHGDYSFLNVMFLHGREATMAAIVDWEMATIGDPLLDLAWIMKQWPERAEDARTKYADYRDMPLRHDIKNLYAELSGRDLSDFTYYEVLANFKSAIVLEGGYARYVKGEVDNPKVAGYNDSILAAGLKAAALVGQAS